MSKNAAREVPDAWRRSVKRHLDAWIAEHTPSKNERQIAEALGMKQPTLNQLLNMKGSFGLHVLLQVRDGVRLPLDVLLDLKDLEGLDEKIARIVASHLPEREPPQVLTPSPVAKRKRAE